MENGTMHRKNQWTGKQNEWQGRKQTRVWLKVESWVDSESNVFAWIMSWFESKCREASWVTSQFDLVLREAAWVMNRSESMPGHPLESWADSESIPWKAGWIISFVDSGLRDAVWVMRLLESISPRRHLSRKPQIRSYQRTFESIAQKGNPSQNEYDIGSIIMSLV